jgi:hypothetical protein
MLKIFAVLLLATLALPAWGRGMDLTGAMLSGPLHSSGPPVIADISADGKIKIDWPAVEAAAKQKTPWSAMARTLLAARKEK